MKMRQRTIRALTTLAVMTTALHVSAQLVFDQTERTVHPTPAAHEVREVFSFVNAGNDPLTLISLWGPKDCRLTRPEKRTYQPGERGEFVVTLPLGYAGGMQSKVITVKTDLREDPTQELALNVDIPKLVNVSATRLKWKSGAEAKRQSVIVEAVDDVELEDFTVRPVGGKYPPTVEVHEEFPGKRYVVTITPPEAVLQAPLTSPQDPLDQPRKPSDAVVAPKVSPVWFAPIELTARSCAGRPMRVMVMAAVHPKSPMRSLGTDPAEEAVSQPKELEKRQEPAATP